jgi:hypothetical protein
MRSPRAAITLLCLAGALAVAGCGSSSSSSTSTAANGISSQSASQIVASAASALTGVHSFKVSGTSSDGKTLDGAFEIPGKLDLTITAAGGASAEVIVIDGVGYLKGNAAYYEQSKAPAQLAAALADKWIQVPQTSLAQFNVFNALTNPKTIGHCLVQSHLGTLSVVGSATVGGKPAIVVKNAGDVPGSTPGELYIATTGSPLPLRVQETGTRKTGGAPDTTCDETASDMQGNGGSPTDLTITAYNEPVNITAPSGAVTIQQLIKSAGGL